MAQTQLTHITIYTDGACIGNPGPGGYGVVLISNARRRELAGGFRRTTNNRMELMAVIVGLRALKTKCAVTIVSDSKYIVDAMNTGWVSRWRANGWMRNKKERAINPDLWAQVLDLCAQHEVKFAWVRGHTGTRENERCDQLSMQAAQQKDWPIDAGYENVDDSTRAPTLFA